MYRLIIAWVGDDIDFVLYKMYGEWTIQILSQVEIYRCTVYIFSYFYIFYDFICW